MFRKTPCPEIMILKNVTSFLASACLGVMTRAWSRIDTLPILPVPVMHHLSDKHETDKHENQILRIQPKFGSVTQYNCSTVPPNHFTWDHDSVS